MSYSPRTRDLLRLTLTPGLGPILIARLLEAFGSPDRVLGLSAREMQRVKGIGDAKSVSFVRGMKESEGLVAPELELAERLGITLVVLGDPGYPPLLASLPDAPPLLYIRGVIRHGASDRYPVALVGSRDCTAYGIEQAERFAGVLAQAGLTIVSGGARGIDTAAHRGALRSGGRTIVAAGCGLSECYPPENAPMYESIVSGGSGALVSELPLRTPPDADNFPARNRIISGLSLGVIVIEAGRKSGALITAGIAAEAHGREVMAVPGRVDSPASSGTLDLLKAGGATLVTEPGDVLGILETPARHAAGGTFAARYGAPDPPPLFEGESDESLPLTPAQRSILAELGDALTIDELAAKTGLEPSSLRSELTVLEIQQRVKREGPRLVRWP
ncbi:MAG: DNA-protecting protein DprA [Phycisphaerales bacterium]|nr:DNA-protecting protein DprA [Phycisphaerales bacterium]